ncbi:hypothetical protein HAX54_018025 [Datura stramonium]|uniref:Uncharacterized protein n=1 Tax=Datura stramonium TaxID=4076 RepID=A0ABS8UNM8_DATST|nr:hypothetical protein [Datura stramonium]
MECMTVAFLGTRLSFAPEYAPPEETEQPPEVSTRRRRRHFIPTDDARRGPSTATPVEPYYSTFDTGESLSVPHDDSKYQTTTFVTPPVATLGFAQFNGS